MNQEPQTVQDYYGKTYPVKWKEVTVERYWDMLEILPPIAYHGSGFMVGEPWTHRIVKGQEFPAYSAFKNYEKRFYECLAPLTVSEFQTLTKADVLNNLAGKRETT